MAFSGLANCGGSGDTPQAHSQGGDVPGDKPHLSTKALNVGQHVLENFSPLRNVCQHVCAYHFYAHNINRQVEAHHYCSHLTEDVRQCVIYDRDSKDAKLIGVEYIIAEHLFNSLPEEEKKYWHSHEFEVKSGQLYAPRIPATVELADMAKVVKTYGKTWHFWQVDRGDTLPLGPPQLMMAFTADGQLDPKMEQDRAAREKVDIEKLREMRKDLKGPERIDPLADHWQNAADGKAWQVQMEKVDFTPLDPSTRSEL